MVSIVLAVVAFFAEALAESDFELGVWEPEFVEIYGNQFIWIIIGDCCHLFRCYHFIFIEKRERNKYK